eukprot:tig00000478_g1283.t1
MRAPRVPAAGPSTSSAQPAQRGLTDRQVTTLIRSAATAEAALGAFELLPRAGRKNNLIHHNALLKALCGARAVDRARDVLERMEAAAGGGAGAADACAPDVLSYNTLVAGYASEGRVEEAEALVARMRAAGAAPDAVTYSTLVHACARALPPRMDLAEKTVAEMRAAGVQPNLVTYNTLVHGYAAAGMAAEALATLRALEGELGTDVTTWNACLHACFRAARPEAVRPNPPRTALAGAARPRPGAGASALRPDGGAPGRGARRGARPAPPRPNAVTYSTMIGGLCDAGAPGPARALLRRLVRLPGPPAPLAANAPGAQAAEGAPRPLRAAATTALLDGLRRAGRAEELAEAFEEAERAGLADARLYAAAVAGLARGGRPAAAEAALREMRRRGHAAGEALFGAVLDAFVAAGDGPGADRLLGAQREAGVPCGDAVRLTAALRCGVSHGRAMEVFRDLGEGAAWLAALRPDARLYTALLESCARDRNARDARAVFAAAPRPDAVLCGVMMRAYLRSGLPREALALFDTLRRERRLAPTAVRPAPPRPRPGLTALSVSLSLSAQSCYAAAVDAATRAGDGARAAGLVREMRRAGHRPSARLYNVAIQSQGALGRADACFELYEEMRAAGVAPTALTLSSLMAACVRSGEPRRALGLLPAVEALPPAERLDTRAYNGLLRALAASRCGADEALALLRHLSSLGARPDEETCALLVEACVQAGRAGEALAALREMTAAGVRPTPVTYSSLVRALAGSMQQEAAFGLLADMRGAGLEGDARAARRAYGALVESFIASGEPLRALLGLREMEERGLPPPRAAFERLIDAFSGSERVDEAFAVFRMMEGALGGPTPRAYGALIEALARAREPLRATLGLREAESRGLRPGLPTYDRVVQRLGEAREVDAAFAVLGRMQASYPRAPARPGAYAALVEACAGRGLLLKALLGVAELQRALDAGVGAAALPPAAAAAAGEGAAPDRHLRRAYSAALAALTERDAGDGYELYRAVRRRWGLEPDDAALAILLSAHLDGSPLLRPIPPPPPPERPPSPAPLLLPASASPPPGDESGLLLPTALFAPRGPTPAKP